MTAEDPLIDVIADAIVDADTLTGDLMPAARAVYAAIAATGRLLPDGGTTEIQHRYRDPDGFTMVGLSPTHVAVGEDWRLTDRRTVTHWPDGRWHFAPWEAVDDHA